MDPTVLDQLKQLGAKKFPAVEGVDPSTIKVHDLDGDDVHQRAILSWRAPTGKLIHEYTSEFHQRNAAAKFDRVMKFAPKVAAIRSSLGGMLRKESPGSAKHQGATVAGLIAATGLRPGSAAGVKSTGHFGISTLQARHVRITSKGAELKFIGKSGKENRTTVTDPDLVSSLQSYKENAQESGSKTPLFDASALSEARSLLPKGNKLKDFRTVIATQTAEQALTRASKPPPPLPKDEKKAKKLILKKLKEASTAVANTINNTPAVAKASYIHPNVFAEYLKRVGAPKEWAV